MPSGYAYHHATGDLRRDALMFAHAVHKRWRTPWPDAMREGWYQARALQAEMNAARPVDVIVPELARAEEHAYRRSLDTAERMRVNQLRNELDAANLAKRLAHLRGDHRRAMVVRALEEAA